MNVYESDRIHELLVSDGLTPAVSDRECDVLVLNTCSVREKPRQKVMAVMSQAKAANPRVKVVVTGCVAQLEPEALVEIGADLVVGPDQYAGMGALVRALPNGEAPRVHIDRADEVPSFLMAGENPPDPDAVSRFVPIQKGCDNWCAFCVVPAARGPERTRPMEDILEECRRFVASGAKELFLLGQNVNSVRMEGGFPELLRQVAALPGVLRIRFTTSHPRDCSPELAQVMGSEPKLMPWLHLPVQSGSSRVLERMGRGYTREHYLELVDLFRREVPGMAFTTDVIVGFPGETDADFEDTLSLVAAVGYEGMYSFMYNERPGTRAATMPDPVPREVRAERLARLQSAHEASLPGILSRYANTVQPVLVEGASARDPLHAMGRNPQNLVVNFALPDQVTPEALVGRVVPVAIEEVRTHTLFGNWSGD